MAKQEIELQPTSIEIWEKKYQLKDVNQVPVDASINDMQIRVARKLAEGEKNQELWFNNFMWAMANGATPAGRILANAGAEEYKPATSLINCTVSKIVEDSMAGILEANSEAGITLASGAGIGYEFSTLRPSGAFINGAGAFTSGPLSFMEIFDSMCFTVSSAGGRRGAQMATFAVWHPDVLNFIKAKRDDGRLRQFNLSLLIDDDFINAVKNKTDWQLVFPVTQKELNANPDIVLVQKPLFWEEDYCKTQNYMIEKGKILCKVYDTIPAISLWDTIMESTYDFAEPGFLLIDEINRMNNNYFTEKLRATNPCGEQPLSPHGSCLLGSVNLAKLVKDPFTAKAEFDWTTYIKVISYFSRMLDNVIEFNGLPLPQQREELERKRRHGMGFLGLGSAMSLLGLTYGSSESIAFTEKIMKTMAIESYKTGIALAKEKTPAPIFLETNVKNLWVDSLFMQKIWNESPELKTEALKYGCRYTHATSIAPTGTIALSVNNNVSNGIEPTFAHKYTRNVIQPGKKSKEAVTVYSYEMLLYKHLTGEDKIPDTFSTSDNVTPKEHVDIQAAAQKWCDSSISKTINVPTDTSFDKFKDIYMYAYDNGLKGCTTFRFNPTTLQGVLVKDDDIKSTSYTFITENGENVVANGGDTIVYDGEEHDAGNLFDAIKEGYYGKL